MKLVHRFAYYLGGMSIGIIFVIFFLSGKDASCSYFPNERVLKEIRFRQHEYSPQALSFFQQNHIDTIVVSKLLHQGNVDFNASQTDRDKPCRIYIIKGTHQGQHLQIAVKECKDNRDKATITQAKFFQPEA